jgi:hypothetical protein
MKGNILKFTDKEESLEPTIGEAILLLVLAVVLILFKSTIFLCLWNWIIVPFFSAPIMTLPVSAGIIMMVGYLVHRHQDDTRKSIDLKRMVFSFFSYGIVVLLIGLALSYFV